MFLRGLNILHQTNCDPCCKVFFLKSNSSMEQDGASTHAALQTADAIFAQGDFKHAILLYRTFLEEWLTEPNRDVNDFIHAWLWKGTCHTSLGEHKNALSCFSSAALVAKEAFGECSQPYAGTLSKQATALAAVGQTEEAFKVGLNAASIVSKLCGKKSSEYGECLYTIGRVYLDKNDMIEAKLFFLESRSLLTKNNRKYGILLSDLALVHECMDEIRSAFAMLTEALEVERGFLGDHHPQTALAMMNLAFLHFRVKNFNNALLLYEEALVVRTAYFGSNHIYTKEAADGVIKTRQIMESRSLQDVDVLLMSDKRVCAMCANVSPNLRKCSKCMLIYYCDAQCQKVILTLIALCDVDFPLGTLAITQTQLHCQRRSIC